MQAIQQWLMLADKGFDLEIIVSIDNDDTKTDQYRQNYGDLVIQNPNRSAVDAVNRAAEKSTGDLLIVVSDDFACFKGWTHKLERLFLGKKNRLLKVFDGTQTYIVTIPIMDRDYYQSQGYVYFPDYKHMFCDTDITHVADVTKRLFIRNDILFRHNHYSVLKEQKDEVGLRADLTWNQGKTTYLTRVHQRFGLPENIDVLDLCKEGAAHREWLRKQGI